MNKLLTLKDLEEKDKLNLYRDPSSIKIKNGDLKAAAIEWIKAINTSNKIGNEIFDNLDFNKKEGMIEWIKHFFNLTEEDLK